MIASLSQKAQSQTSTIYLAPFAGHLFRTSAYREGIVPHLWSHLRIFILPLNLVLDYYTVLSRKMYVVNIT